jgi:hypothetical protein
MFRHDYFLSAENPIANVDQRDLERLALRLLDHPEVKRARAAADHLFRQAMADPLRDQMSRFDQMIDEYVFHHALRGANSDAAHPKVLRIMSPPGRWFRHEAPGSRWAGDSPDFIYRIIPIAHGGSYEIRGQPVCEDPPSVTFALMGNTPSPVTLGVLESRDLPFADDGGFVITIDATAADGRPNHLQTKPGEHHLLIRDALGDWLAQTPYALRVRRIDGPDRAPLSEDALASFAARSLLDGLYYTYYCTQSGSGQPANDIRIPQSAGPFGGLASQWGTKGNLELAEDEALIVRMNSAGALFRNVVLCDRFFLSLNYWSRTGSFNMAQMAADDDGLFTFVVAHQDPGVHNWLDTGGLNRTIFGCRWQVLPRDGTGEAPFMSVRRVRQAELDRELPPGVRRISAAERSLQIAQREAGFGRRFIES